MSPNFVIINKDTKVIPIVTKISALEQNIEYLQNNFNILIQNKQQKNEGKVPPIIQIPYNEDKS